MHQQLSINFTHLKHQTLAVGAITKNRWCVKHGILNICPPPLHTDTWIPYERSVSPLATLYLCWHLHNCASHHCPPSAVQMLQLWNACVETSSFAIQDTSKTMHWWLGIMEDICVTYTALCRSWASTCRCTHLPQDHAHLHCSSGSPGCTQTFLIHCLSACQRMPYNGLWTVEHDDQLCRVGLVSDIPWLAFLTEGRFDDGYGCWFGRYNWFSMLEAGHCRAGCDAVYICLASSTGVIVALIACASTHRVWHKYLFD